MKTYKIGIDVGGTNTDAVLVDAQNEIVALQKVRTTEPVNIGIVDAISRLLTQAKTDASSIQAVFLGTTYAINALLQKKDLYKVGLIRITGYSYALSACVQWPDDVRKSVFVDMIELDGGYLCDGRVVTEINESMARKKIMELLAKGVESIAIVGSFSPLYHQQEKSIAQLVDSITNCTIPVTCSYEIAGVGFIQRENATMLNAALKKSIQKGFASLSKSLCTIGIEVPINIVQNNGTIIPIDQAMQFPIFTLSSGTTNSFVGASKLAQCAQAVVVDMGGTSTDIGIIQNGFARESNQAVFVGGVEINFRMPDMISYAIGGGSYVTKQNEQYVVGPDSAGYKLFDCAYAFGGDCLTFTDVCLIAEYVDIEQAQLKKIPLTKMEAQKIVTETFAIIQEGIRKIMGHKKDIPVFFAGGASRLCAPIIESLGYNLAPYASVANAYGAACAQVSGSVDEVVVLDDQEKVISDLTHVAIEKLKHVCRINVSTIRIVAKEVIPYHYMPQNMARIKITAAADLL